MKAIIKTPTKAYLENYTQNDLDRLTKALSYTNTSKLLQYRKVQKSKWFKDNNPVEWQARLDSLKDYHHTLLFSDSEGVYFYAGSVPYLIERGLLAKSDVSNAILYPVPKPMTWKTAPKHELYPYQRQMVDALKIEKHGAAVSCTGSGKSLGIMTLTKELGLRTVIVVPSQSIFGELLPLAEKLFGKDKVGAFGDGKKKLGKQITIAIARSLSNVKENSPEWKELVKTQVFIGDEGHLLPAETLASVCHGVFADVPYRFFFTGTHARGDGSLKLLQAITGKVVFEFSTEEAVKGGYICNHEFKIVKVSNHNPKFYSPDPLRLKRELFLKNPFIEDFIVKMAGMAFTEKNQKSLVLVEETSQIARLVKKFKENNIPVLYAHSDKSKKDLLKIGLEPVNNTEQVEKFNKGECAVLIGTSCIGTGTNIHSQNFTYNFQGGSSEVKTRQGAVGRSVRKLTGTEYEKFHPPKNKCIIFDFDVADSEKLKKMLEQRIECYKDSGTPIQFIG